NFSHNVLTEVVLADLPAVSSVEIFSKLCLFFNVNFSVMSSKKKATITACEECKCTTLLKDSKAHADLCSSLPDNWEMSLIKPRRLMKGFAVHLKNWEEYLPPNAGGWLRRHSVLIHPQAMEILKVTARQPVRVVTPSYDYIGVIWPCKELGVLRLSLSDESAPGEKLISIIPIWSPLHLQRISISLETTPHRVNDSLKDYVQMYLTNAYVQPGLVIPINYYGKVIRVIPEVPLDISAKNMSLEDGELESEPVVFLTADCTVSISISSSESALPKDHISSLSSIGGMHTAKKTLLDFVLTPFLNEGTCCSLLLWGLPGSGKTLLLSTIAKILGGSAYYFQSMEEFNEEYSLIPRRCIVILDWPTVDKEHRVCCGHTLCTAGRRFGPRHSSKISN
ncbi:hypothetical protein Angca_000911, partial [Angiostrongylus cantonensis]